MSQRTVEQIDKLLLSRMIEFWALPFDEQREIDRKRWVPTEEMYDLYLRERRRRKGGDDEA